MYAECIKTIFERGYSDRVRAQQYFRGAGKTKET